MTNELKSQTSPVFRYSISSFQHQENKSGEVPGLPMWFQMWSLLSSIQLPGTPSIQVFLNELKYKHQTYYI